MIVDPHLFSRVVKVWIGREKPTRLHFEAQVLRRGTIDGEPGVALEIGFHAEERDVEANTRAGPCVSDG